MEFNAKETDQLIRARRSVFPKDYTGQAVPDEVVSQILENARWAPNHKLTEPWRFVVFTGDGLKKLAEFQSECYKQVTTNNGTFKEERYQALLTKPMQSSHIISVGMKRDLIKGIPEIEEIGVVFCAVENMYLTATAYGVGSYLSTGGITHFEEAKVFFDLGKDDRLLGFFHLGMPRQWPESRRTSLENKVKWVR